jgi:hypothetical protein
MWTNAILLASQCLFLQGQCVLEKKKYIYFFFFKIILILKIILLKIKSIFLNKNHVGKTNTT